MKRNKKSTILVVVIILVFPAIILGFFAYSYFFLNGPAAGDPITRSDWMLLWGAVLGYVGTVSLGLVALHQSNQANQTAHAANQMTRHLMEVEHKERLAFVGVDSTRPLLVYLQDNPAAGQKGAWSIAKEMNSTKIWFSIELLDRELNLSYNDTDGDYILFTFFVRPLNAYHVKHIQVNSIKIKAEQHDTTITCMHVWTDCGQFLEAGNSYKVATIFHGMRTRLMESHLSAEEYLSPAFDFSVNVTLENLYGDKVTIDWSMAAELDPNEPESLDKTSFATRYQLDNIGFHVQEDSSYIDSP